ncbi:MAG: M6 family metalloprotease domain-containing protein [Prevotella sp.]|nr:M6 family metalloprotease domain-containing protein [Prevotella sp.]
MKKTILSICLMLCAISASAVKAFPEPIQVTQSDGTTLTVLAHGDEDYHWFTTTDGVLLAQVGTNFYVAEIASNGVLTATTQLAHEQSFRNIAEKQLVSTQNSKAFYLQAQEQKEQAMRKRIPVGTTNPAYFPHTGEPKAMVILVEFSDLSFSVADAYKSFNDYLNGNGPLENYGLREDRNHGSVKEYFTDMSQGLFSPQFDLFGPVKISKEWTYYGKNSGDSDSSTRIQEMMREACEAIDDSVDFSQYDSNGDGYVDLVYFIYAGYSESMGASSDCIWPKSGTSSVGTYDGVSVSRYGLNNELNYTPDYQFSSEPYKRINGIGLFCHEFSHTMGLPDMYPTNSSAQQVDNQTMEYWDLMDSGEYTDRGYTPTPYTPWEKEVMGWTEITELTDTTQLAIDTETYYRISGEDNEYLILQNLQNKDWASKMLGHGLLVYRVDYTTSSGSPRTTVNLHDYPNNTAGKPGMTLVPADSLLIISYRCYTKESEKSEQKPYSSNEYINSHYGDPYPGTSNVTSIESVKLNRSTLVKPIYNIQEESGIIYFDYLKDFIAAGIDNVETVSGISSAVYDLQGRKISAPTKGIYIRNGKKFVVK